MLLEMTFCYVFFLGIRRQFFSIKRLILGIWRSHDVLEKIIYIGSLIGIFLALSVFFVESRVNSSESRINYTGFVIAKFISKNDDIKILEALGLSSEDLLRQLHQEFILGRTLLDGDDLVANTNIQNELKDVGNYEDYRKNTEEYQILFDNLNKSVTNDYVALQSVEKIRNRLFYAMVFVQLVSAILAYRVGQLTGKSVLDSVVGRRGGSERQ